MSASSRVRPPASSDSSPGSTPAPTPIGARCFAALQRLLPQHLLSRIAHRLARVRCAPVKNALIGAFVRGFHPRMSDAAEPDARRYGSFNEFFTRALRPGARQVDPDVRTVVSPVDGAVSEIGYLDRLTLVQAKGRSYRLDALLASRAAAERFAGGAYATLYLAPGDYHRIHMPAAGELRSAQYVPGRLFSVNAATAAAVSDLYAR
ncbi:MAG: archaetidylserine decarboxylase, partial [Steroidobacteraceae bacterium]